MKNYKLLKSNEHTNEDGYTIIEEQYGYVDDNGNEIVKATFKSETPNNNLLNDNSMIDTSRQSQLDRIEIMLSQLLGK